MIILRNFLIICAIATVGFFAFFNFSLAEGNHVAPPCINNHLDPCVECGGSGNDAFCSDKTSKAKPVCRKFELDNKDFYFICMPESRIPVDPAIEFKSYTDATSFADLICKVTAFISHTILPPIAVLMMLAVGFMFLVSGGAPQKSAAAQKALLFTVVGVFLLLLAPGIVKLIGDLFDNPPLQTAVSCGSISPGSIVNSFIGLVNWFSWFVAITSVVMGLYSGFLYLTARDDPAQAAKAAKVLSFVIIGVAVSILAFSIITIVKQFAGLG